MRARRLFGLRRHATACVSHSVVLGRRQIEMRTSLSRVCLVLLLAVASCGTREPAASVVTPDPDTRRAPTAPLAQSAEAAPSVAPSDAPPPEPGPATVERIAVPRDSLAAVVRPRDGTAPGIVFLPGVCSNAYAYLLSFPEAARAHGGVVAIDGDQPCGAPNSGFHSFSWDPIKQNARVEAALRAAGITTIPREGLTLVGYSAGASIGELMVQRWPSRYARVVLIGAPSEPSSARLADARGVVTMSCSRDVPVRMRDAAKHLVKAGVPATYVEMPGCTHGNVADGEHVFGEAFDWLEANSRPTKDDAAEEPLPAAGSTKS
jgi:pimeloyl-ACP methyl ester carboxylesterase